MPDGSTVLRVLYWIVPSGMRCSSRFSLQSGVAGSSATIEPNCWKPAGRPVEVGQLELAVGRGEGIGLEAVRPVGVALDHLGERVGLQLRAQVHARRPVQVVQPVVVLQLLQLRLEDVVEGAAEQAAEQVGDLGETADPQVDAVQAGRGHAVGVVAPVVDVSASCPACRSSGRAGRPPNRNASASSGRTSASFAGWGRRAAASGSTMARAAFALRHQRGRARDRRVRAVGRHEVDQRLRVLEVLAVVGPAVVRLERRRHRSWRTAGAARRSAAGCRLPGPWSC